jgi:hypothetical protein
MYCRLAVRCNAEEVDKLHQLLLRYHCLILCLKLKASYSLSYASGLILSVLRPDAVCLERHTTAGLKLKASYDCRYERLMMELFRRIPEGALSSDALELLEKFKSAALEP